MIPELEPNWVEITQGEFNDFRSRVLYVEHSAGSIPEGGTYSILTPYFALNTTPDLKIERVSHIKRYYKDD